MKKNQTRSIVFLFLLPLFILSILCGSVMAEPELVLSKSVNLAGASAGDQLTYTLTVENQGDENATGIWLNDTLPASAQYHSSTDGAIPSGRLVTFDLLDILPGGQKSVTFTALVDSQINNGISLDNTATADYRNEHGASQPRVSSETVSTVIGTLFESSISLQDAELKVQSGDMLQFRIDYSNLGGALADLVWINITIPENLEFTSTPNETATPWPVPNDAGVVKRWRAQDVGFGSYYILFSVTVKDGIASGQSIPIRATCYYTNTNGQPIAEFSTNSISLQVGEVDPWAGIIPLLIPLVAVGITLFIFRDKLRSLLSGAGKKATDSAGLEEKAGVKAGVKAKGKPVGKPKGDLEEKASEKPTSSLVEGKAPILPPPPPPQPKSKASGEQLEGQAKPLEQGAVTGQATAQAPPPPPECPTPKPGDSYLLVTQDSARAFQCFKQMVGAGHHGMCLSRTHPDKVREQLGLEGLEVRWLSTNMTDEAISPVHLERIIYAIGDHLEKQDSGVVLLDGLEYLVVHNNFSKVLKFVHSLQDQVAIKNGTLLVPVNETAIGEEHLALLKRDMSSI